MAFNKKRERCVSNWMGMQGEEMGNKVMSNMDKKRLAVFIALAYGVTAAMSIFMFLGLKKGYDLTHFMNVQMMYPACGVILGKILFRKEGEKLPMVGYVTMLVMTAIMMAIGIVSPFVPEHLFELAGVQYSQWNLVTQYIIMLGSIVVYIAFWACGTEKRENAGLCRKNIGMSVIMIIVFLVLYMARFFIASLLVDVIDNTGMANMKEWGDILTNSQTWIMSFSLIINFFFCFIVFFGEEYGWRYYFQPLLMDKFGKRAGVLILGVLWGFFHLNADFMFYTTTTGPQYFVAQVINCVAFGIFIGYSYMKTQNIWVPVIMHMLNNNLIAVFAGGDVSVIQNQEVTWAQIPMMLVYCSVFALFILAPIFGKKEEEAK